MATKSKPKAEPKHPPFEYVRQVKKDGSETHWYRVNGESMSGRGVTTLIGNGYPKGALKVWAAKTVAAAALDEADIWQPLREKSYDAAFDYLKGAPDRDRDAAANKGQEVHHYAERLAAGEEVEVPEHLIGHVDAYLDWRATWQPLDELVEIVVYNQTRRYLGRFDILAGFRGWFPNDPNRVARVIVDIKTNRSGVYPDVGLQLAAYRFAEWMGVPDEIHTSGGRTYERVWNPEPMPEVDGMAVLHLREDGWSFVPLNEELARPLFAQFLHAVKTAEFIGSSWRREDAGWSQNVLLPPLLEPFDAF